MTEEQKPESLTEVPDAQPLAEEMPKAEESGKASAKSKKGGKKKRMSKKELARRRREKAEQERLEQERIEKELEEKRIHEQEQEMERREQERLQNESRDIENLRNLRRNLSKSIRAEASQVAEWERYTQCNHATNPLDQSDVNSFISQWTDMDDTDMNTLFHHIELASNLLNQLIDHQSYAAVASNVDDYERFTNHIMDLRKLIQNKLELLTQHHLLFSDKYTGAKNEVLLSAEADGYGYGLWVNLAKNPRIKDIDFTNVAIEISKNVAMTSLAIRMSLSPYCASFGNYLLLSPVLACEFFQLPSPPKRIGAITLRQCSTQGGLQPLPYPLRNVNTVQPNLVFKLKIKPENLPDDTEAVTVIKIDDLENTSTSISGVEIDTENAFVKFSCKTTGLFALAVPKYIHFPFQFWEINSSAQDTVEIFVRTALTEISIVVDSKGMCSMETPIQFSNMTAPAALELLQRHGINIVAPKHITEFGETTVKLIEKTAELEEVLAAGIADTATGFRLRCSKWNSQLAEDRVLMIAREIGEFGEAISEDEMPNEEEEQPEEQQGEEEEKKEKVQVQSTHWHAILAKAKHINEVAFTENADEPQFKMLANTAFHQHLMPMLMDIASDNVHGRVRNVSSFTTETVHYLLQQMKLFSVTI